MTVYNILYDNKQHLWPESNLTNKLDKIGKLEDKKIGWIRWDLSIGKSNWFSRFIWTAVAKHFTWMRRHLYGVDLEKTRSLLLQIRPQIEGNSALTRLYEKAVGSFNKIAPHHLINNENAPPPNGTAAKTTETDAEKEEKGSTEKVERPSKEDTPFPGARKNKPERDETEQNTGPSKVTPEEIPSSHRKITGGMPEKEIALGENSSPPETKEKTKVDEEDSPKMDNGPKPASSKTMSIPDLIKKIIDAKNWTAEQTTQAVKEIIEGQGKELTQMHLLAINKLAQIHIDEINKVKEQKEKVPQLIQGSCTQFDKQFKLEGKSACTCINLVAAEKLVKENSFEEVTPETLDSFIKDGIALWKDTSGKSKTEHLELTEIDFGKLNLKISEENGFLGGYTKRSSSFNQHKDFKFVIEDSIKHHYKHYPYAIVFTKPPETASIIVRNENEFWLYDSHGDPSRERKAFVEKFASLSAAADELHYRFPYVDPTDLGYGVGSYHDYRYNGFSAYILVKKKD